MKLKPVFIHENQWEEYTRNYEIFHTLVRQGTTWPIVAQVNAITVPMKRTGEP